MGQKGRFEIAIVAFEKIRDLALAPDFHQRVQELTLEVQNRHGVTLNSAQQSLYMARRHFLNPEHDIRPLPNNELSRIKYNGIKSEWLDFKESMTHTIGDVAYEGGKLYLKKTNQEVQL